MTNDRREPNPMLRARSSRVPCWRTTLTSALSLVVLSLPFSAVQGSGGDGPGMPLFVSWWGPTRPLMELANGSLGVVEATWWRRPLLLAWYRLNEQPLPADALSAFRYESQFFDYSAEPPKTPLEQWRAAVKAIAPELEPEREPGVSTSTPGTGWDGFENCPAAAWTQARITLVERAKRWGQHSPALRDWILAQHRVFARCSLGPTYYRSDLPPLGRMQEARAQQYLLSDMALSDPPSGAPPLLGKDRDYQRAAALFYEGHYESAEAAFNAIANDPHSPWQPWGRYLALRARFRNIQLTPSVFDPGNDYCQSPECIARREQYAAWRASASARLRNDVASAVADAKQRGAPDELARLRALDSLVAARLDPATRFRELASELAQPGLDPETFRNDVVDYLHLHRQFPPTEAMGEWLSGLINGYDPDGSPCRDPQPARDGSDRANDPACLRRQLSEKALARYLADTHQRAWLFTAAVFAERGDPQHGTLMRALSEVPAEHPGATTFLLQRLRLGEPEQAEALAEQLLQRPEVQADYSARNRVHEYRMRSVHSLTEFWAHALRIPGYGYDLDTLAGLAANAPAGEQPPGNWDADSQWLLDYELPRGALLDTARHAPWPAQLRQRVAYAVWARSVLLGDPKGAREAIALVRSFGGDTSTEQSLQAFDDDARFLLESRLRIGSDVPMLSGWCRFSRPDGKDPYAWEADAWDWPGKYHRDAASRLLSAEQQQAWHQERQALEAIPFSSNVWMQAVLDLATQHPTDPRVPDLLKQAVYTPRLNYCGDESTGELSRRAFTLLKKNYPKSAAARSTKYWFKPGR